MNPFSFLILLSQMRFPVLHCTNLNPHAPHVFQVSLDRHNMAVETTLEEQDSIVDGNSSMDRDKGADMGTVDSKVVSASIAEVGVKAGSPSTAGRQQPWRDLFPVPSRAEGPPVQPCPDIPDIPLVHPLPKLVRLQKSMYQR